MKGRLKIHGPIGIILFILAAVMLAKGHEPFTTYFYNLSSEQRDLWTTLFPAAAAFRQASGNDAVDGIDILNSVRSWSTSLIDHYRKHV